MGKWLMRLQAMVLVGTVLVIAGCPSQQSEDSSQGSVPKQLEPPTIVNQPDEPVKKEPIPIDVAETTGQLEPMPTSIPSVSLPASLKETCLVAVGDPMPQGELSTVDGEKKSTAELFGKGGAVVFFWAAGSSELAEKAAAFSLADLQADVMTAYADSGLAVVAINPQDPPEKVKQIVAAADVSFPVVLDTDGSYFSKVATEKLPRVYVLDPSGKIAWFDVEFSEVTRETLEQTLRVVHGEPEKK